MSALFDLISKYGNIIADNFNIFLIFGIVCIVITNLVVRLFYREQINTLKERLQLAQDKVQHHDHVSRELQRVAKELDQMKEEFGNQPKINIVGEMPQNPKEDELYFVTGKRKL